MSNVTVGIAIRVQGSRYGRLRASGPRQRSRVYAAPAQTLVDAQ